MSLQSDSKISRPLVFQILYAMMLIVGMFSIIEYSVASGQVGATGTISIPNWVKNNAKWWGTGQIGDSDFIQAMQYLIENKIIVIPGTASSSAASTTIPSWVKNNAKWWGTGQIGDSDFIQAMQYLIQSGIIHISSPIPPPSSTNGIRLDQFGVQMFYAQENGRQSIALSGDPNKQPGIILSSGGPAVPQVQGAFHYYTITPYVGTLSSDGSSEFTMRINLIPTLSNVKAVDWKVAEIQGYQSSPMDIDEFEQTGYLRVNDVTDVTNQISFKQGAEHQSSDPELAGTSEMRVNFDGKYGETWAKELTFPKYESAKDPVAFQPGNIVGKWIGIKVISVHVPVPFSGLCSSTNPCQGQLYKTYVDLDPIDFTTGLPKNNWKFLASHLDDGTEKGIYSGHKTTWGKKTFQYRVNQAKSIDFAYLSVYDIDPTTGQNIPR